MMTRLRWLMILLTGLALVGLCAVSAGAADDSKVNAATKQVERGAHQIGQGKVIEGAEETAKGIGNTVVEGAKFSGQKLEEAGKSAEPEAKTAWQRTKEGAAAFGTSVKNFFGRLFGS